MKNNVREKIINNKFYKNNTRGISLIVLVITIIVIIILAAAVILTLNNNNPITEANKARYESDVANMQAIFTNTVAKVMAQNQSTIEVNAGELNSVKTGGNSVEGRVNYTVNNPLDSSNENGTIIFNTGTNNVTTYYTGKMLPLYSAGETTWYVDSEGVISLKVGEEEYGKGEQVDIDTGSGENPVTPSIPEEPEEPEIPEAERAKVGEKVTGANKKYKTKDGIAIIPVGFTIVPGLDVISEGLVISDDPEDTEEDKNNIRANGNQFVWIPVTDESKYIRNTSYVTKSVSQKAYTDKNYLPANIQPDLGSAVATSEKTLDEVIGGINEEAEREHVVNKGGFYIARYEAGGTQDNVISKKNTSVLVNITQERCKTAAQTMFKDNNNVKSALISGIQWDMTMAFINSTPARKDGLGVNDYDVTKYDSSRHIEDKVVKTGYNLADKVCNIYDLEGNAFEYVAEKNTYSTTSSYCNRGGPYNRNYAASHRGYDNGNAYDTVTFRVVLYVM